MVATKREMVPTSWALPKGFTWDIVRVIHCMPDDQVDGWRVVIYMTDHPVIEVIHREAELAREIALDAALQIYPGSFKGFRS